MMTTTLGALFEAEPALLRLAGEKLPFAVAYRVAKLTKAVGEETRHFHEQRNALVKQYGEPRNGNPDDVHVLPAMATWAPFVAAVQELASVPVTLPLDPIDLVSVSTLTITAADLLQLGALVTAETTPAPPTVN